MCIYSFCMCVNTYVHMCVVGGMCTLWHVCRSESNLWLLFLSFRYVGCGCHACWQMTSPVEPSHRSTIFHLYWLSRDSWLVSREFFLKLIYILTISYSYIILNKFLTSFFKSLLMLMCVFIGLQVFTYVFVHVWRPQGTGGCLPNLLAPLFFGNRVSYWAWISLIWLGWLTREL